MAIGALGCLRTWFQSVPSLVIFTPRVSPWRITSSMRDVGIDHISDCVKPSTWPFAVLPARPSRSL